MQRPNERDYELKRLSRTQTGTLAIHAGFWPNSDDRQA